MTLLAAFQTLLCRYTQQERIRVGTPVAGRGQLATEGLIGFFVNTVVMQTELGGNPTFKELLARVREAALEAYAHQEVPFEKLVEELRPVRSLRGTPLFNVWFALRNIPSTEIKLKSLTLGEFTSEATTAKFDLGLLMSDTQRRLRGAFEYDSDLFNVGTIEEMVGHFKTLLREVVANPDLPLLDIPLLVEEGGERADEIQDRHAAADVEAEFSF
jgi:non-ribosomal peptide synthetase component F